MDMRYLESVHMNRAIVHVLDRRMDEPLLAVAETELTEDLHEFFMKHTLKALRSDEAEKASFVGEGTTQYVIKKMFADEEYFVEGSQELARRLFQVMRPIESILPGDLAVIAFHSGEARYLGILKMDYQKNFIHEIDYLEDQFNVRLTAQEIGLPLAHQKLSACAFIKEDATDDSYDMVLVERSIPEEGARYFLNRFLGASKVLDRRDKTKLFRKNVEQWTRQHLKNDIDKAAEVREQLNDELLGSAFIDLDEFAGNLFADSPEAREKFDQKMEKAGLVDGDKIEVDRNWVNNKMKSKALKTDTGFVIRAEHELFDDSLRFEVRRNGDGSVDYIIKNVRNVFER